MRIIAALPLDSGCFRKLKPSAAWAYRWEYDNSDRIRIYANVEDPWRGRQKWEIRISEQKGNRNGEKSTIRIDLECYPVQQDLTEAIIEIEEEVYDRGVIEIEEIVYGISHSTKPTIRFYTIRGDGMWVKLSFSHPDLKIRNHRQTE